MTGGAGDHFLLEPIDLTRNTCALKTTDKRLMPLGNTWVGCFQMESQGGEIVDSMNLGIVADYVKVGSTEGCNVEPFRTGSMKIMTCILN